MRHLSRWYHRFVFKNMIPEKQTKSSSSKVQKFQQVLQSSSSDGWDKCWEEGLTPWDLGSPTPVLLHLLKTGSLPKGRALIPGCGSGHDVVAIACAERHVVGIDVSETAIKRAIELSYASSSAEHFTFIRTDFFSWHPTELYDLIFDYTFFCAIEPDMRPQWARKVCDLLKPDGELITLMYPIDDHEGGPPYKVSVSNYEEVLRPVGFTAIHIGDNEFVVAPRRGREKLGRWKRFISQSSL